MSLSIPLSNVHHKSSFLQAYNDGNAEAYIVYNGDILSLFIIFLIGLENK